MRASELSYGYILSVDWDDLGWVLLLLGLGVELLRGNALVGLVVEHGVTLRLKIYGFSALEMRISFPHVTEEKCASKSRVC